MWGAGKCFSKWKNSRCFFCFLIISEMWRLLISYFNRETFGREFRYILCNF